MSEHEIKTLKDQLDRIEKTLQPIADAYNAAQRLGAWGKYLLYFIASILGILLTIKNLKK
jgi:hypothetical protein